MVQKNCQTLPGVEWETLLDMFMLHRVYMFPQDPKSGGRSPVRKA